MTNPIPYDSENKQDQLLSEGLGYAHSAEMIATEDALAYEFSEIDKI